jgi:hypothetical protein
MRGGNPETHRNGNFEKRLKETMDTESDPEMYTPMSTGQEEMDYADEKFPLVKQFNQTNMRPGGRRPRSTQSQMGKDND